MLMDSVFKSSVCLTIDPVQHTIKMVKKKKFQYYCIYRFFVFCSCFFFSANAVLKTRAVWRQMKYACMCLISNWHYHVVLVCISEIVLNRLLKNINSVLRLCYYLWRKVDY